MRALGRSTPVVRRSGVWIVALLGLALAPLAGCYNGKVLVARARSHATSSRIEEIELGSFRVTLPRDNRTTHTPVVEVRLFGEAPLRTRKEIEKQIKDRAFLVNDRAMTTLRKATLEELHEPSLDRLRARLLEAVNGSLEGAPLLAVGISDYRLIQY
ncbi:MAG: hypothetical protein ACRCT8_03985 [Lacipirellulaceae bacterium]